MMLARFRRFTKRMGGSPRAVIAGLAEEAFVRIWSKRSVRNAVRPFLRPKTPDRWAMIGGCFNSGTTLLQRLVGAHPDISRLPREGLRFTDVLSNLEENGHHMIWDADYKSSTDPAGDVGKNAKRILQDWSVFLNAKKPVFMDKSVANSARIPWLDNAFGQPYFIMIHRNGLCVSEGLLRRASPPVWYRSRYETERYRHEDVAQQWVSSNADMLAGLENAENGLQVSFEAFVDDPVGQLARIFEFLDLDPNVVQPAPGGVTVAGQFFEILDPNPNSLKRLSLNDREALLPLIAPMMTRLGYDMDEDTA